MRFRDMTIKRKLLLIFYVQILLPLLLIVILYWFKTEQIMSQHALNVSSDMLTVLETRITDFTRNVKVISQDLLYDQEIYDVLQDDRTDTYSFYLKVNNLKNTLRMKTLSYDEVQSITVITRDRRFFSYDTNSGRANIENIIPYDFLIQKARRADGAPVWYVDEQGEDKNVFLVRTINDRDLYDEIGLMAVLVDKDQLSSLYGDLQSAFLRDVAVMSPEDKLLFDHHNEDLAYLEKLQLSTRDQQGYVDMRNMDRLVVYRSLEDLDWTLVTAFSRQAITQEFQNLQQWSAMIFIPLIILLSVLSITTGLDIVAPIQKLVEAMKRLKKEEGYQALEVDRQDELGYLTETFNDMVSEMEYLVKDIYQEQLIRKDVEMKALQAQINPHFLFNTLETINWRAQMKGAPEISEMVMALSKLMEANIGREGKLVTIQDEVDYVENYLSIMRQRYAGRLEVRYDIAAQLKHRKVPRLLLQPIVENALQHGIGQTDRKGVIQITAKSGENGIVIVVLDNGNGMTEDKLEELNGRFQSAKETMSAKEVTSERMSIGLTNVNQRLKLLYGESFGLSAQSRQGSWTAITIHLPANATDKGDRS